MYFRKQVLYCLRKGALRTNISKEVKESNQSEVQEHVVQVDLGRGNDEQVYNIHKTNAQINDPNPCELFIAGSGASSDYQEIQDVVRIYATSEVTYQKIDPDLRNYDSEYFKVQYNFKPKVPPKLNFRMLPTVPVTDDERNADLDKDQRTINDVDYLHPIESASGAFKLQPDTEEYQHSAYMGDNTLIAAHQTLIDSDESIYTPFSAEEEESHR